MTASTPPKQPMLNEQHHVPVQQEPELIKDFATIIDYLSADKGLQSITNLVSERDSLRARNEELTTELKTGKVVEANILDAVQNVKNENQSVKDLCAQKDVELRKSELQASELRDKLRSAQEKNADLEMELKANKKEIDRTMASEKQKEKERRGLAEKIEQNLLSARKTEEELKAAQVERDRIKKQCEIAGQELAAFRRLAFPLKPVNETELRGL